MARWLWLTLSVSLVPCIGTAEEQSEVERRAFEAFETGERLFEAEDYLAAASEFEEAYRLLPTDAVHYNIARCYELAQMPGPAVEHYRAFLEASAGNAARRRVVRQRLLQLERQVGWVILDTDPPLGRITIDNRDVGSAPVRLPLGVGAHQVEAQLGVATSSEEIFVEVGERELTLNLVSPEPEPEPEPLAFESPSSGTDDPDGEDRRSRRGEGRGLGRLHHAIFWVSLGLTVGSSIALGAVGSQLLTKSEEYRDLPSELPDDDPQVVALLEEGRTLEMVTTALWISSGVLAGTTILLAIFTDWSALRRHDDGGISWRINPGIGSFAFVLDF